MGKRRPQGGRASYDVSRPHDSLFRAVFSDEAAAVGLLQGYLPESVAGHLKWSTLAVEDTSFVDPELRDTEADLLYEVRQHSGRRLWLYVLLEHQSEPDRWMRWRLLRYCCRIWERDRRRYRRRLSLRPIVPLVLYHGASRWRWSREFSALFPAEMRQRSWLPHWEHLLIDLAEMEPERVRGELKGRIAQLGMIAAYRDAWHVLRGMLPLLVELYRQREVDDFSRVVLYVYATQREEIRERFGRELRRQVPGSGGDVMNYVAQLVHEQTEQRVQEALREATGKARQEAIQKGRREGRREGRAEGLEEGRAEGLAKGRQEGELAAIERLVRAGVDWSIVESATEVDRDALRSLKRRLGASESDKNVSR